MSNPIHIDTSVFIRFATQEDSDPLQYKLADKIISAIQQKEIYAETNALVIAEIAYVLTKVYKFNRRFVSDFISSILDLENLHIDGKDILIQATYVFRTKNIDFADAYKYSLMVAKGQTLIATFDKKHFKSLDGIEIV